MAYETKQLVVMPHTLNKVDPVGFDVTINALLIGLGAEKYVNIFRKHNIGQSTIVNLTNEDLMKLGVDDDAMREKILSEVKNLPLYEESVLRRTKNNLSPTEIVDTLEETSQLLYKIHLSALANTLSLKKTKDVPDCVLYKDLYASDIAINTIKEITNILDCMENALNSNLKMLTKESSTKNKKLIVGSIGSAVIMILAFLFTKSVKQL